MNLATRVRSDALDRRTRAQLRRLSVAVAQYAADHGGQLPAVTPLIDPATADRSPAAAEAAVSMAAARNSADVRRCLGWPTSAAPADDPLIDPWGTPIAFMPRQNPLVGMAAGDRPFFVSAGPDRRFLTRADNRYSYDYADDAPAAVAGSGVGGAGGVRSRGAGEQGGEEQGSGGAGG